MRPLLFAVCLIGLFLGAATAGDDAAKKELAKVQGTWQIVSAEQDGQPLPDSIVQNLKFVFKGDSLVLEGVDDVRQKAGKIMLKLDTSTTPKCMDWKVEAGSEKDKAFDGIYDWKDDQLRICLSTAPGVRPGEFETKEGSKRVLFVLKRQK
jgi:uncharacterized protein (TIGR03067 family)